jgi:hypothetical protein
MKKNATTKHDVMIISTLHPTISANRSFGISIHIFLQETDHNEWSLLTIDAFLVEKTPTDKKYRAHNFVKQDHNLILLLIIAWSIGSVSGFQTLIPESKSVSSFCNFFLGIA